MVKSKNLIFIILISSFLLFSFSPTLFEISQRNKLADPAREFILEHNYYWPDYNLYLSKIRQGFEGRATALERYTSEEHSGSLIQIFYVGLGHLGRFLNLEPNYAYLLGRIIFPLALLLMIRKLVSFYFPSSKWQILAFLIVVTSGSFPRFWQDSQGITHVGRFMEWWSNIDALQRLTFIPHILFGQVVSFYLLYHLTLNIKHLTRNKFIFLIILGNAVGLVFPPSLITLNGVILLILLLLLTRSKLKVQNFPSQRDPASGGTKPSVKLKVLTFELGFDFCALRFALFVFLTLPSLLYIFFLTKTLPWSALVDFHRTHPMMIPFRDYILATGPIFFLGLTGMIFAVLQKKTRLYPLLYWILVTFFFAFFFTYVKDQSPLRFTQTGLFIPLGILGTYFFQQIWQGITRHSERSPDGYRGAVEESFVYCFLFIVSCFLFFSLYMMTVSLNWQTTWISQRIGASIPPVPYPPQTMYPLKSWMEAIRWLRDNTSKDDVVLAAVTAGNYIPAYSGNTVYFGQANTFDYERKQQEVDRFFAGKMGATEAQFFLTNGRIKYVFFSLQEKEKAQDKDLTTFYPFLGSIYQNPLVTIYKKSQAN